MCSYERSCCLSVVVTKVFQSLRPYSEKCKGGKRFDLTYTVIWTVKGWYSTNLNIGFFWELERVTEEDAGIGVLGMPLVKVSKVTSLRMFTATVTAVNGICCAMSLKERYSAMFYFKDSHHTMPWQKSWNLVFVITATSIALYFQWIFIDVSMLCNSIQNRDNRNILNKIFFIIIKFAWLESGTGSSPGPNCWLNIQISCIDY